MRRPILLLLSAVTVLLSGCGDSDPEVQELSEPLTLQSSGTSLVLQSTGQTSKPQAADFCLAYGLRLANRLELQALSETLRYNEALRRQFPYPLYWGEADADGENAFAVRPATGTVDTLDRESGLAAALCAEGEFRPPAYNEAPTPPTKLDMLKGFANLPGVKLIGGAIFTQLQRQLGFDDYTNYLTEIAKDMKEVKAQLDTISADVKDSQYALTAALQNISDEIYEEAALEKNDIQYPLEAVGSIEENWEKFTSAIAENDPRKLEAAREGAVYAQQNMRYHLKQIHARLAGETTTALLPNYEKVLYYRVRRQLGDPSTPPQDKMNLQAHFKALESYYLSLFNMQKTALELFLHFNGTEAQSSQNLVEDFRDYLLQQAGNTPFGDKNSFSHAGLSLVLRYLRPNDPSAPLLPEGSEEILKRLEYERRALSGQWLNGLAGAFVVPADMYPNGFTIEAWGNGYGPYPATIHSYAVQGPLYDHLVPQDDGPPVLQASRDYRLYTFNFMPFSPGNYRVRVLPKPGSYPDGRYVANPPEPLEKTVWVGPYQDSPAYGFVLLTQREHDHYGEQSAFWSAQHFNYEGIKSIGGIHDWPFGIEGTEYAASGKREMNAHFHYAGQPGLPELSDQPTLNVDVAFDVSYDTKDFEPFMDTPVRYILGIYDKTEKRRLRDAQQEVVFHKKRHDVDYAPHAEENVRLVKTISFTPTPGHDYYFYLYTRFDPGTRGTFSKIERIRYLHLRFVPKAEDREEEGLWSAER